MNKPIRFAVIGGTGLEEMGESRRRVRVRTPFGLSPPFTLARINGCDVIFVSRHGAKHVVPPHMVNYRANIWALKKLDVRRIIATNAAGGINPHYKAGDIAIPIDIIDFTKARQHTFYNGSPVTHIDVSEPYCPEIRSKLLKASRSLGRVWSSSVLGSTEGPRFETPAEIRMMDSLGCDLVCMSGAPEVFLARELEMCYASLCYVSNRAAGLQKRLTAGEVMAVASRVIPRLKAVIGNTIRSLQDVPSCSCWNALAEARMP